MESKIQINESIFKARFEEENLKLTFVRARFATAVASFLYFSFLALDYVSAPADVFPVFVWLRIGVVANYLIALILFNTRFGYKYSIEISLWLIYVSVLGISLMSTFIGGFSSQYYIGIIFVLSVPAIFLPWSVTATVWCGIISVVTFMGLNFAFTDFHSENISNILGPFLFLASTVLFAAFANMEKTKSHKRDLELRMQIEHANEELQELDKAKMRFFANVSHELRTPLTLILGPLEQMLYDAVCEEKRPILKAMETNSHRLLRQVNAILDFAKLDAGKLVCEYQEGNIGAILSELLNASIPFAQQKRIELQTEGLKSIPSTLIDNEKMETVAANILSNALKFTPEGGKITVRAGSDKEIIWFEIEDTGIGIPEEKLSSIFDRFLQVEDSHNQPSGGTGLGLAMVKELTQLHGGTISVRSEYTKGAMFRVEIPKKPILQPDDRRKTVGRRRSDRIVQDRIDSLTKSEFERRRSSQKKTHFADAMRSTGLGENKTFLDSVKVTKDENAKKILVVEDNPDLRTFVASSLADEYIVLEAENGQEGLDSARKNSPDLIISDVMMPVMDGHEFCRQIRSDPSLKETPFILVTSKTGGDAVVEGLDIGATDFVPKPFEIRELKARIAAHLNNQILLKRIGERETRLIALGQMTSALIHDFSTPLTSIFGLAQLTQMEADQTRNKKIKDMQIDIIEQANRLSRMREEILEFAKGYTPKLKKESTPLVSFIDEISNSHRSQLTALGIELIVEHKVDETFNLSVDRDQIKRVFDNLIKNAKEAFFSYSETRFRQKSIWIATYLHESQVAIRLADNGHGIPDEIIKNLFEPFTSAGKIKGTGLGLATVKNLITAHNGEINVESRGKEGGAVFTIYLNRPRKDT
jgi:signal transduction histidine kinase